MNVKDFTAEELDLMNLVGTLTPKTAKGKQRVKEWGARGAVMRVWPKIPASPEEGLWFAVCAGDRTWRWVCFGRDKDFDLEVEPWAGDPSFMEPRTHANFEG